MIPDQNVYLANSSVVPYQPVFKQDHQDMSPTPCLLKAFFFFFPLKSNKHSSNLDDVKKVPNTDVIMSASGSRKLYNLLHERHTLEGRSTSFLLPLQGLCS